MSTSIKLYATNDGKAVNSTFSSINPNATPAQMKTAAQALNSLTQNTYSKSEKIETTDLDVAAQKSTPTLTIDPNYSMTREQLLPGGSPQIFYTGNGKLYICADNDNTSWCTTVRRATTTDNTLRLYIGIINSQTADYATVPHNIVIRSEETDDYLAGEWTFTITE